MAIARPKNILAPDAITLPTMHAGQVSAYETPGRFLGLRCGRRWGKTEFLKTIAADEAIKGRSFGWFVPEYKFQSEVYFELEELLYPVIRHASKNDGVIRTITGGRVDFWTLNNPKAGRSRKYHGIALDEVAFAGTDMADIWRLSIRPTLLDYGGYAIAASTPNGDDAGNFFWQICNLPELGFVQYHAPTHTNPLLPPDEVARLEKENHPLVFRQEYLAEFVDWKGQAFFMEDKFLENGVAPEPTMYPDAVFAVIDTTAKGGEGRDGTAVTYFAASKNLGHKLAVLDWEITDIQGNMVETWIPNVLRNLEMWADKLKARHGSLGAFVEDKAAGIVINQNAAARGLPIYPVDSKLTALGKDERCISVSSYAYQGLVKITRHAYQKVITYKGVSRNHWLAQVCGYRVGVKNQADDLLDTFTYGVSMALGNKAGY